MNEKLPQRKPGSVEVSGAPISAPVEDHHLEQSSIPISEQTRAENKKKLRAVIVNMERIAEQAARDSAERSLTTSVEQMRGVSGFFRRIWTQTLAREYYRQKHVSNAKQTIRESGNIYGAELEHPVGKEGHEVTALALVDRFTQEYEEMLHEGETRSVINREGTNGLDVKGEIMTLMKRYAAGEIGDDDFNEAKKQVLHTVSRVEGNKRGDSMYADNLLEIARHVKQAVEHGEGIDALDLDLDVVLGNARDSIRTEAKYNVVDRAIEFAKKTPLGVLVNESTLASGVAIAAGVITGLSKRAASSRLAAWGTFGASVALSGGIIGYAENKRTKEERSQHAREMAQGRTYEKGNAPRREEMDKLVYEMRDASQLAHSIREAKDDPTKLSAIADAEARIRLMDREGIDLLSYSDPMKVERERFDLDMARAQAKAELRRTGAEGQNLDDVLDSLIEERAKELTKGGGGIEERDRLFSKMKTKRVAGAAAKGVLIGLTVGTTAQEATAFFNDEQVGFVEHLSKGPGTSNSQVVHMTWMESLRHMIGGGDSGGGVGGGTITEHINTTVTANEYLENHKIGSHISRDGWYDNDTPKPVFDKNELKLWWGGNRNTGIDANGNYVFSVKQMLPEGSYHKGLSANAQELMKEGKLKMLLSLSQGTQAHPVEVLINPDGTAAVDPKSETGRLFFAEQNGKATFLGRFAEVAEVTGSKDDTDHVRILATHEGKGVNELTDVVTREVPVPLSPREYVVDPPPLIPIFGRRPLEPVSKGGKGIGPMTYYGMYSMYGSESPKEEKERRRAELSPTLRENPNADLDALKEEKSYLDKQEASYKKTLEELTSTTEPLDKDCKVSVCIPVAGHQEKDVIYKTLQNYTNQELDKKDFEIVLFVNNPTVDPSGRPLNSLETLKEIDRFKKDFHDMKVRVLQKVLTPEEAKIGYIRKILNDAVISRHMSRGEKEDLVMVSNDADMKGVAPEYLKNFVDKFEKNPRVDSMLGQLDFDPEAYIRNPLVHIGTRLFQYLGIQSRRKGWFIDSSGANFAFKSGMYAAVGGYPKESTGGEDSILGIKIKESRDGSTGRIPIDFAGARVSRLYTSSRRAESAMKKGLAPVEQWNKGFSAYDDEVRQTKWENLGRPLNFDDKEEIENFIADLEKVINRTVKATMKYNLSAEHEFFTKSLRWLGLKFEVSGNDSIKIVDASELLEGLKEYQKEGMEIMKGKTSRRSPSKKLKGPPTPTTPELVPA